MARQFPGRRAIGLSCCLLWRQTIMAPSTVTRLIVPEVDVSRSLELGSFTSPAT